MARVTKRVPYVGVVGVGVHLAVFADDLGALVGVVKGEGEGGEDAGVGAIDEVRKAEEGIELAFGGGAIGFISHVCWITLYRHVFSFPSGELSPSLSDDCFLNISRL